MIYQNLQLASILDVAGVIKVMDALCAVPGVDGVHIMSGESEVEVRFDRRRTSTRELAAVLARSGYPQAALPA
jgi:copper chaperone CopZ